MQKDSALTSGSGKTGRKSGVLEPKMHLKRHRTKKPEGICCGVFVCSLPAFSRVGRLCYMVFPGTFIPVLGASIHQKKQHKVA